MIIVKTIAMYSIFLSLAKPKGIGPMKPPTATFVSPFSVPNSEAMIIKNMPMKIKTKPNNIKPSILIFTSQIFVFV